jgi:CheY-like chemotaxis protein
MKVLVVDDEPDVKALFEQRFRREARTGAIELFFALSAEEALDLLKREGVAEIVLILSDINMPGMNGLELLRALKERYPQVRVYMITAYADESSRERAIEYGCDDYLTKPIDFAVLKQRIGIVTAPPVD